MLVKHELKSLSDNIRGMKKEDPCIGITFRYKVNAYVSGKGEVCFSQKFVPLKRKSCKGCANCDYLRYEIEEAMSLGCGRYYGYNEYITWSDQLKNGDICKLQITNVTTDWETGIVDGYDLEFVKVEGEK